MDTNTMDVEEDIEINVVTGTFLHFFAHVLVFTKYNVVFIV